MSSRRIEMVKVPFDYYWPKVSAMSCIREMGVHLVKDEVADAAVRQGYAVEFDPAPTPAPKKATTRRKTAKPVADAAPADTREPDPVDRADLADDDRPDGGETVADAG